MKSAVRPLPPAALAALLLLAAVLAAAPPVDARPALHPALTTSEIEGFGFGGFRVVGRAEGGWLLVGTDPSSTGLRAVPIAADGTPGDPADTPELDVVQVILEAVAVAPSGRWAAVWYGDPPFLMATMRAGLFEADGTLVRELDLTVPDEMLPAERRSAVAGFAPDGELVIAWGARTSESVPADDSNFVADLFAARFSAGGERILGPALVNEIRIGHQRPFAIEVLPDGVVVGWDSWCCEPSPLFEPRARVLAPDLSPRSAAIEVVDDEADHHRGGAALVAEADGRFAVAWRGFHSPRPGVPRSPALLVRRFEADGSPAGPEVVVTTVSGVQAVAASSSGVLWVVRKEIGGAVFARPFTFDGMPLDASRPLDERFDVPVTLGADPDGRLLVMSEQRFGGAVHVAAIQRTAPPPKYALTSPQVPGFRVWVRIIPPAHNADPLWGSAEPLCIPETLCASGAVPGRTEALVRIVGPKPNGFLWPTLVKLTTSRVEVWIEQEATGELQHYVLRGARPGFDELPGLFDRTGFQPQ